tara:strand:- start:895 stop:2574 length:1680 start_codon:yes stop_codon:yes gene_type:complete
MANEKITDLDDGGALQAADATVVARNGENFKILGANMHGLSGDVDGPASSTDGFVPQWDGVTGKNLKEGVEFKTSSLNDVSATLPTSNQILKYNSATSQYEPSNESGGGNGDVSGPGSSTTGGLAIFDDATGKNLGDSGVKISNAAPILGQVLKYNGSEYSPSDDATTSEVVLTQSGDVTVPANATEMIVTLIGSGSGGAAGGTSMGVADLSQDAAWNGAGGGGGASGSTKTAAILCTPGEILEFQINPGGAGGTVSGGFQPMPGANGGTTFLKEKSSGNELMQAPGGKGGSAPTDTAVGGISYYINGGKGGSGELGGGGGSRGYRYEPDGSGGQTLFEGSVGLAGNGYRENGLEATAASSGSGAFMNNSNADVLKGPGGGGAGLDGGTAGSGSNGGDAQNGYGGGGGGGSGGLPITNGVMVEGFEGGKGGSGRATIKFISRGSSSFQEFENRYADANSGTQSVDRKLKTHIIFDTNMGDCTVNVPENPCLGQEFIITKFDSSMNQILLSIPADTTVYCDSGGAKVADEGTSLHVRYLFGGNPLVFGSEGQKFWTASRI